MEPKTILHVKRVTFGTPKNQVLKDCEVVVDGQCAGTVGKDIPVDAGDRTVTVDNPWFSCRPIKIHARGKEKVVLHYRTTLYGWLAFVGFAPLLVLSWGTADWVLSLFDAASIRNILVVSTALLLSYRVWAVLAGLGFYSYTLSVAPTQPAANSDANARSSS